MAGSDLPPAGSGAASPAPRIPLPRRAKRKRGDSEGPPPSVPSRATRGSTAAARKAAREASLGVLRTARRAAAGALWKEEEEETPRGRGLCFRDVERMRALFLGVRLARFEGVPDDHPDSPFPQISYLWSYPRKPVGTDPVEHLATLPEWKNKPSEEEVDDYKAATLAKLGSIVCPLNMDISATDEPENTREWVDKCNCSHPGSEDCVRVHVQKARSWIKNQLGEEAFKNCGLDVMGEQVGELWTAVDKKKLEDVDKLIPQNKPQNFMNIALRELSQKERKDLAKYYYNVFLPRRLASLTRAKHKKDEAIDTGDEKSCESDGNNGHRPRKKSKSSGSSSSTRSRKWRR